MILRTAIALALAPLLSCYAFAQGPGPGEAAPGGNAGTAGSGIGNVSGAGSGPGNFPGTAGSGIGNVPGTIVRPQFYSPSRPSPGGINYDTDFPGYGHTGGGAYYGGTYGGGTWYMSGLGDYVRSAGEYNLSTSEAMRNIEETREQYFENRNLAQQIWFEMRDRNDAYRAERRGPRITSEQVFRLNAQRAPQRLAEGQIDPVSGELAWPGVLREEIYNPFRVVIDEGFALRTRSGSFPNYETHKKTVQAVDSLAELLRSRIREYEPQPYVEANSFVEALAYDARFPSN